MNIPLTEHRMGSLSTRTTHPYFMGLLQELLKSLDLKITIVNPYQFKTKGEMMLECKDLEFLKSNYPLTMSCSHPDLGRWKKKRIKSLWRMFAMYYKEGCYIESRFERQIVLS